MFCGRHKNPLRNARLTGASAKCWPWAFFGAALKLPSSFCAPSVFFWGHLGASGNPFGTFLGVSKLILEAGTIKIEKLPSTKNPFPGNFLRASRSFLESFWQPSGNLLGAFRKHAGPLGVLWNPCGSFWNPLEPFRSFWEPSGTFLGLSGSLLGAFGKPLEAVRDPSKTFWEGSGLLSGNCLETF